MAVIGTGASAIQIVPEIVNDVGELQLYQRTPPWVMPRPNNPFPQGLQARVHLRSGAAPGGAGGIYWLHEGLGFAMTQQPALLRARWNWSAS